MSHTRADRKWVRGTIMMSGQRVGCHTIKCSECDNSKEVLDRGYKQLPFDEVERRFAKAKWFVGKNEKHDLCPACVTKKTIERRAKRTPPKQHIPTLTLVPTTPIPMKEPAPMTVTMPDRPISREDKRLINIKLHEVYIGEKEGYYAPHTDASVAKDLGIPVAWVRDLREEMFGPAHSNSEIDDKLAKIEAATVVATKLHAEADALMNEISRLVIQMPKLRDQIAENRRVVESLTKSADTIKKAVGA